MYGDEYKLKVTLLISIDNGQLRPYTVIKYVIFFACLIFFMYRKLFRTILICSYGARSPPIFNSKQSLEIEWRKNNEIRSR